jgi:hypothetical protein
MKQRLGEKNTRLPALSDVSSPNDDQPVTRAVLRAELHELRNDLRDDLRAEFNGKIDAVIGTMDHLHNELVEKMRDMQTEVLRAFHSWARPIEIRLRSFDDMQQRLGLLEERISAIERRG